MQKNKRNKKRTHKDKEESKNYFQIYGVTNDYSENGNMLLSDSGMDS